MGLLLAHLRSFDTDAPTASERLQQRLGPQLAHKLVFALTPDRRRRRAA